MLCFYAWHGQEETLRELYFDVLRRGVCDEYRGEFATKKELATRAG